MVTDERKVNILKVFLISLMISQLVMLGDQFFNLLRYQQAAPPIIWIFYVIPVTMISTVFVSIAIKFIKRGNRASALLYLSALICLFILISSTANVVKNYKMNISLLILGVLWAVNLYINKNRLLEYKYNLLSIIIASFTIVNYLQ